ncbi:hypothetical protein I203_103581 [Kwoniella mangroviensis CBS 8507]|uniref:uncharacterized protein n=1 Tax=Kwoniella mangroviensis CBS 8507 TaxID=1296122 RepID=UPI00080D2B15|nr:uncharacterized protein I203_04321 [Kwoniella mangroviensis CBS 8507]OCF66745.1 hypothetical protein I203_04321 [Kwoniella mangroviensis CBS 8507]
MTHNQLVTLAPPPPPPSDLIASALFLPLHAVNIEHRGRKLRFVGQVLAFHPPTSLLLLTSFPAASNPHSPSPTILVNISIPLMGQSPSLKDVSAAAGSSSHNHTAQSSSEGRSGRVAINREALTLNGGEWVNVVGWLEGDGERMVRKVKTSSSYLKPLPIILEAIHLSNARPPPVDAMYRGNIAGWDGTRTDTKMKGGEDEPIIIDDDDEADDVLESTPKSKR